MKVKNLNGLDLEIELLKLEDPDVIAVIYVGQSLYKNHVKQIIDTMRDFCDRNDIEKKFLVVPKLENGTIPVTIEEKEIDDLIEELQSYKESLH